MRLSILVRESCIIAYLHLYFSYIIFNDYSIFQGGDILYSPLRAFLSPAAESVNKNQPIKPTWIRVVADVFIDKNKWMFPVRRTHKCAITLFDVNTGLRRIRMFSFSIISQIESYIMIYDVVYFLENVRQDVVTRSIVEQTHNVNRPDLQTWNYIFVAHICPCMHQNVTLFWLCQCL